MNPEYVLFAALRIEPDSQPAPSKPLYQILTTNGHTQADNCRVVFHPDDEPPLEGRSPWRVSLLI